MSLAKALPIFAIAFMLALAGCAWRGTAAAKNATNETAPAVPEQANWSRPVANATNVTDATVAPPAVAINTANESPGAQACAQPQTSQWPYPPEHLTTGERKLLVILWDPHRPEHPPPGKAEIENAIFGPGPSARDYFLSNSNGKFRMEKAAVLGWYGADKPASHYWAPTDPADADNDGWISGHVEKWAEAIRKADKEFDFSAYDADGNGILEPSELGILIVIPQNDSFGTNRQPSGRQYPVDEPLAVDGVTIPVIAEAYVGYPPDTGTVAHELSHLFQGTPDMYFNFFQPYAASAFSLMDQPWGLPYLDPYNRMRLGWLAPQAVSQGGCYHLEGAADGGGVLLLYAKNRGAKEYFLIENRQPGAYYDARLPDTGLGVWNIVSDPDVYGNLPAPKGVPADGWATVPGYDWGRRGIRMIRPEYGPPYDFHKALWDGSDPKTGYDILLNWSDGTPSGFAIRNISASAKMMNFTIEVPG